MIAFAGRVGHGGPRGLAAPPAPRRRPPRPAPASACRPCRPALSACPPGAACPDPSAQAPSATDADAPKRPALRGFYEQKAPALARVPARGKRRAIKRRRLDVAWGLLHAEFYRRGIIRRRAAWHGRRAKGAGNLNLRPDSVPLRELFKGEPPGKQAGNGVNLRFRNCSPVANDSNAPTADGRNHGAPPNAYAQASANVRKCSVSRSPARETK